MMNTDKTYDIKQSNYLDYNNLEMFHETNKLETN